MVASFRETFITFALVGLFIFSILSFISISQKENGVTDNILTNDLLNKTFIVLQDNLTESKNTTQTQRGNFESEIPERGFGSLLIFSIVSVGQKFTQIIVVTYNTLIVLPATFLGVPVLVANVLSSILVVTLILLVWRVYRIGG